MRIRLAFLAAAIAFCVAPALAQDAILPFPPDSIPVQVSLLPTTMGDEPAEEVSVPVRIAGLFRLQASVLEARAAGDEDLAEAQLLRAVRELHALLGEPQARDDAAFAEAYQTIVSQYERTFGPSDSLFTAFGDIYAVRADLFSELNGLRDPLLEDLERNGPVTHSAEVPLPTNELVQNSIAFLLKNPDRHINNWLSRSYTYLPMIEQIFAEEGVPEELKYLAMIESGLNPRARSWAQAAGMWQFIASTGRAYDLNVDGWVDERMDPERATRAAARHLKDLYARWGDWHVALAGYNCSPRCLKRAMRSAEARGAEDPDFWDMYPYLPRETRGYVPMFVAASLVASNPNAYGLSVPEPGPTYAYEVVPVKGTFSLEEIAELAGSDEQTLRALNPALRRWALPPSRDPFPVRLPLGSSETFLAAYDALPEARKRPAGEHVVRSGDTLSEIATAYSVSLRDLKRKNGLSSDRIRIGQRLVVPMGTYVSPVSTEDEVLATATSVRYPAYVPKMLVADAPIVRRPEPVPSIPVVTASDTTPEVEEVREAPETPPASNRTVYRVRRGDNLTEIARAHSVRISDIRSWNSLRSDRLAVGQRLVIYSDGRSAPASEQQTITYRVKNGDTLWDIASAHNVSVRDLRSWNDLQGSRIRPGQRLTIRSSGTAVPRVHEVQHGDTLIGIAQRYGVSVDDIKGWNELRTTRIKVGQTLSVGR